MECKLLSLLTICIPRARLRPPTITMSSDDGESKKEQDNNGNGEGNGNGNGKGDSEDQEKQGPPPPYVARDLGHLSSQRVLTDNTASASGTRDSTTSGLKHLQNGALPRWS